MVINPGEQTMTLIRRIFANGWQSLSSAFLSLCALLAPAVPAAITAFTFILVDMYYGYKVSKKYGHKEIESSKVWKTVNKLTEAAMLIILAFLLDEYIFNTFNDLIAVRVAAGSICTAEILSLLESLRALHPKAKMSKLLSKVIKSKAEKYLDIDMSDIIEDKDITDDTKHN